MSSLEKAARPCFIVSEDKVKVAMSFLELLELRDESEATEGVAGDPESVRMRC